jgi:hypothetical protein
LTPQRSRKGILFLLILRGGPYFVDWEYDREAFTESEENSSVRLGRGTDDGVVFAGFSDGEKSGGGVDPNAVFGAGNANRKTRRGDADTAVRLGGVEELLRTGARGQIFLNCSARASAKATSLMWWGTRMTLRRSVGLTVASIASKKKSLVRLRVVEGLARRVDGGNSTRETGFNPATFATEAIMQMSVAMRNWDSDILLYNVIMVTILGKEGGNGYGSRGDGYSKRELSRRKPRRREPRKTALPNPGRDKTGPGETLPRL